MSMMALNDDGVTFREIALLIRHRYGLTDVNLQGESQ
jgi:hypothetical protein